MLIDYIIGISVVLLLILLTVIGIKNTIKGKGTCSSCKKNCENCFLYENKKEHNLNKDKQ